MNSEQQFRMNGMFNLKLIFAFIFFHTCGSDTLQPSGQCKSLPITLVVLIDWTNNMNSGSFDKDAAEQILSNIIPNLADGSRVYINAIGENFLSEIVSFDTPFDKMSLLETLRNYDVAQSSYSVNLNLVDEELGLHFSVNEYRRKAELVLVLVNAKTETTGNARLLYKKKTSIGVIGDYIPSRYIAMASNESHVHLINNKGVHLTNVTNTILNQILCDSKFLCDRDKYRTERGTRCMNCSNACGDDEINEFLTCMNHCPYRYRPSPRVEKLSGENLPGGIIAIIVVCILFVLSLALVIFFLWRRRQQKRKNARTIEETFRKDRLPVMEEGDLGVNARQAGIHDPEEEGEQPDEDLSENSDASLDGADNTGSNADADNADQPSSDADHPSSNADHPSSDADHPSSDADHPSSDADHPSSDADHPSSDADHHSPDADHPSSDLEDSSSHERTPLIDGQSDLPDPNTPGIVSLEERHRLVEKEQITLTFRDIQANVHVFSGDPVRNLHKDRTQNLAADTTS